MKTYKLSELIKIKNGADYKHLTKGTISLYGTGGLMGYVNDYLFDGESVLLPRKGSLDNIMYVNGKFWTVDTMYWTIIDKSLVYPKYLYYYLSLLDLSSRDSGSTLPSMTFDSYYTLEVNLPSLKEQKKIIDVINPIDNKIEINSQINDNLSNLASIKYNYWFTQFDFPNHNSKAYKSTNGQLVWNNELKKSIPSKWTVMKLKDTIEHINTGLNPRNHFVLNDGDIKYVTVKNLTVNGTLDFKGSDTISIKTKQMINKRSKLAKGDVLFASIAPLGRCFIVNETPNDWEINESVFSIRPNKSISAEYLYLYFMSDWFIKTAEHNSTGSIFSGIRISSLENMPILVPDANTMASFTKEMKPIFELRQKYQDEILKLESLREYLLPMLMNGQTTISD